MDTIFEAYTGQSGQVATRHARHALARADTSAYVAARYPHDADVGGGQLLTGNVSTRHARRALVSALADTVSTRHVHGAQVQAVPLSTASVTTSRAPWRALASATAAVVRAARPAHYVVAAPGALQPTTGVVSSRYAHGAAATGFETSVDTVLAHRTRHALATELVGGMVRAQHRHGVFAVAPVPLSGLVLAWVEPTLYLTQGANAVCVLQDALVAEDALDARFVLALLDLFNGSDTYRVVAQALQALADGATLADIAASVVQQQLLDALIGSAVLTDTAQLTFLLSDAFRPGDGTSMLSQVLEALADSFYAGLTLHSGDDLYTAWVMTPETKAMRSYSNFPFNSYAMLGGQLLGASATGIYRMGAPTDNGAAIQASIRTGLMNLGTQKLKRIDRAYLGATADGSLLLRVQATTASNGQLQQTYRMTPAQPGVPGEHRVDVGRGFRSVYWTFEIANDVDGADFELHNVQVLPLVLTGRVY